MKVVHTIKDLQAELAVLRAQGKKVGLVPTMGALHAGHASLVKRSVSENGVTVVSVFVNPTQFNDKNDLEKYPRTLDADCRLLEECGADFAFAPSVSEMYPEPDTRQFSYAPLDTVMEGAFRPGHFNGVCQIVSKLFDAVQPDRAYFGEKDFQQLAIIREMVRQLKYNLEIVGCSIGREAYFKVTKDPKRPFIVKTKTVQTRVLGTEFNIRSYTPEDTHVVLINGKVEVSNTKGGSYTRLYPGEDAHLQSDGNFILAEVDLDSYVYWKDGYFYFDNVTLKDIMQNLGRWYNVNIEFRNKEAMEYKMHFISDRTKDLEHTISLLNRMKKVTVTLQGNTLTID